MEAIEKYNWYNGWAYFPMPTTEGLFESEMSPNGTKLEVEEHEEILATVYFGTVNLK